MLQYDLMICKEVMKWYYANKDGYGEEKDRADTLWRIIRQHRFVWSRAIANTYQESLEMTQYLHLQNYITSVVNTAGRVSYIPEHAPDSNYDNFLFAMIGTGQLDNPMIICGECDNRIVFARRIYPNKSVEVSSIQEENIKNYIHRVTPDFTFDASEDELKDDYVSWFGELFKGEKTIKIIDNYILDKKSKWCILYNIYLKSIERGSTVEVYTKRDEISQDIDIEKCQEKARKEKGILLKVYCNKEAIKSKHDRYIYFGSNRVVIGQGLDFLDPSIKRVKVGTQINLKRTNENDKVLSELAVKYETYRP